MEKKQESEQWIATAAKKKKAVESKNLFLCFIPLCFPSLIQSNFYLKRAARNCFHTFSQCDIIKIEAADRLMKYQMKVEIGQWTLLTAS